MSIRYQSYIAEILEVSVEYANIYKAKDFNWIERLRCRLCKKSKKSKKAMKLRLKLSLLIIMKCEM